MLSFGYVSAAVGLKFLLLLTGTSANFTAFVPVCRARPTVPPSSLVYRTRPSIPLSTQYTAPLWIYFSPCRVLMATLRVVAHTLVAHFYKINYVVSTSTPSIINTIISGVTVFVLPLSRKAWRRAALRCKLRMGNPLNADYSHFITTCCLKTAVSQEESPVSWPSMKRFGCSIRKGFALSFTSIAMPTVNPIPCNWARVIPPSLDSRW
jgi:hypothetical protein